MTNRNKTQPKHNLHKLTTEEVVIAEQMYAAGMSLADVGDHFNIGRNKMHYEFKRLGIHIRSHKELKPPPSKLKPEQISEAAELYQAEFAISEIAECYGVSFSCMRKHLLKAGVKFRDRSESSKLIWELPGYREHQVQTRIGISPPNKGAHWKLPYKPRPHFHKEKSHLWKGGKTPLRIAIRAMSEYNHWRKQVFERDNYTCAICGDRGRKGNYIVLHADHITPLSVLVNQFNVTTVDEARNCEGLWEITNGRTLCKPCHLQTPTYGRNRSHLRHAEKPRKTSQ